MGIRPPTSATGGGQADPFRFCPVRRGLCQPVLASSAGVAGGAAFLFEHGQIGGEGRAELPVARHHFVCVLLEGGLDCDLACDEVSYKGRAGPGAVCVVAAGTPARRRAGRHDRTEIKARPSPSTLAWKRLFPVRCALGEHSGGREDMRQGQPVPSEISVEVAPGVVPTRAEERAGLTGRANGLGRVVPRRRWDEAVKSADALETTLLFSELDHRVANVFQAAVSGLELHAAPAWSARSDRGGARCLDPAAGLPTCIGSSPARVAPARRPDSRPTWPNCARSSRRRCSTPGACGSAWRRAALSGPFIVPGARAHPWTGGRGRTPGRSGITRPAPGRTPHPYRGPRSRTRCTAACMATGATTEPGVTLSKSQLAMGRKGVLP